jgi:hypothetical protein
MEDNYKADLKEVLIQVKEGNKTTTDLALIVNELVATTREITRELKLRPEIDTAQHNNIMTEQGYIRSDVDALKANQRYVVLTIIGSLLLSLWNLITKQT